MGEKREKEGLGRVKGNENKREERRERRLIGVCDARKKLGRQEFKTGCV